VISSLLISTTAVVGPVKAEEVDISIISKRKVVVLAVYCVKKNSFRPILTTEARKKTWILVDYVGLT